MKITYIYNSGFMVETQECLLIFDCYRGINGPFPKDGCLEEGDIIRNNVYVFASHSHPDHFNKNIFKWAEANPKIKYIFSHDIKPGSAKLPGVKFMDEGQSYSDKNLLVKVFGSTDEGVSFMVRLDGQNIFHAGDLNMWHWKDECPAGESQGYIDAFYNEIDKLKNEWASPISLAFFPVDPRLGTDYYEGAVYFAKQLSPKYLVPMHFGGNFDKAAAARADIEAQGVIYVQPKKYGDVIDPDLPLTWDI